MAIFIDGQNPDTLLETTVTSGFFVMLCVWCVISIAYLVSMVRQTFSYHTRLKQVFADHEGKTLWWLVWSNALLVLIWLYTLVVLLGDGRPAPRLFNSSGVMLLALLLVWRLSAKGLAQMPGFSVITEDDCDAENHHTENNQVDNDHTKNNGAEDKDAAASAYQRSALDSAQQARIADKLQQAIHHDKLYLDPQISLYTLAKHIGEPARYLSQTFSQHMQTSFFDVINQARIDAAKRLLVDSDDSVIDIAHSVGFNARSSFYAAFKASTGNTPSAFRKAQRSSHVSA